MTRKLYIMLLAALAVLMMACSNDEPSEPQVSPDPRLEYLEKPVWRYSGKKGDGSLDKITYTMRDVEWFLIRPMTEQRKKELAQFAKDNPDLLSRESDSENSGYWSKASRDIITKHDYVSDRYFLGYHHEYDGSTTIDCETILPMIAVKSSDASKTEDLKKKLLKKYSCITNVEYAYHSQDILYLYCNLRTSAQVLQMSNEIFMLDGVNWAEPDMYGAWHFAD